MVSLAAVLTGLSAAVPPLAELAKTLFEKYGDKKAETDIDRIQSELLKKISEQQVHVTEALSGIYRRLKYMAIAVLVSLIAACAALVLSIINLRG